MRLNLRADGVQVPESFRELVEDRLHRALGRFQHQVDTVWVRLTDENGPRNGKDIRCHLEAHMVNGGVLRIEEQSTTAFRALSRATERIRFKLLKRLDRQKAWRRGRAS